MAYRGRLQVKPEKQSKRAGPVPVKIEDVWSDAGKVRIFTFSDGTTTRVPWERHPVSGAPLSTPPSLDDANERRAFPSELEARRNEALAPMWLSGARAMANGAVLFGVGVAALGVGALFRGVSLAVDAAEIGLDVAGFVRALFREVRS